MPVLPFGEFRPDVSDYSGQHTRRLLNVLPRGDGYGPFPDFSIYSAALPGVCRGYYHARNQDGTVTIFAATSTNLYKLDNTDFTWDLVSKVGGYTALANTDNWCFRQFNEVVIACQLNTVPQAYTLGTSALFANLGGTPPQARYVDVVNRFLVLSGFDNTMPYRIHWSGYNAITTWTQGVNQCDYQDFPTGGIVRGVAGGETGYVMSDSSVRRMTYNPGSPTVFNFDIIEEDIGLYAPTSLIRSRDRVFYLGPDGFKMLVPGGLPKGIGKEKVDRSFFGEVDASNLRLIIGVADPKATRVIWAYKSQMGSANLFDRLLAFDWALDRWAVANMSGEYIAALARPGLTLEALDAISTSIETMTIPFDDIASSALAAVSGFDSSHRLGFYTGAPLEAVIETAESSGDGKRFYIRGFRPVTDAATVYGKISKRELASDLPSYSPEKLINRIGSVPVHVDTRFVRGIIRIPAGTSWTYAAGVEPDSRPSGGQ